MGGQPYPMVPGGMPGTQAPGATASLVCGIVSVAILPFACFCGFLELVSIPLGIVAAVLGFRARRRIAESMSTGNPIGGSGKALAGIITGFIAIGLGVIVGGFLLLVLVGVSTLPRFINAFPTPTP